jgi:hypothetical protein
MKGATNFIVLCLVVTASGARVLTTPTIERFDRTCTINGTYLEKKEIKPLFVHVPKCGTSFALFLMAVHCYWYDNANFKKADIRLRPDNRCLQKMTRLEGGHRSLPAYATDGELASVVTMVRSPNDRIASGLLHNFHGCRSMAEKYNIPMSSIRPLKKDQAMYEPLVNNKTIVLEYANCVKGMTGCLFTLGEVSCHNEYQRKPIDFRKIDIILRRMEKFAFIGLVERWRDSMCLYNRIYGRPGLSKFADVHRRKNSMDGSLHRKIMATLKSEGFVDKIDEAIYSHATRLFESKLSSINHA